MPRVRGGPRAGPGGCVVSDDGDDDGDDAPVLSPPPELAPEGFAGLAGRWVEIVAPHTEASPGQILVTFLACAGSAIGPSPRLVVGPGDHHRAKLYVLLVGPSTTGAKDRTLAAARLPFAIADPAWFDDALLPKLNSGAGLIHAVRDRVVSRDAGGEEVVTDAGAGDPLRRAFACLPEFAGVLRRFDARGETLSQDLREAWGNATLGNTSIENASRSTLHHVSVVGAITPRELRTELGKRASEVTNGFLNRFIIVRAREVRDLPRGGTPADATTRAFALELRDALDSAQTLHEVTLAPDAGELWDDLYPLLKQPHAGILNDVLAKGRAQVVRIALIYALLERSTAIQQEHLLSALAVWDFARASAGEIFGEGDLPGDEGRIVTVLERNDGIATRTQLRRGLHNAIDNVRLDEALRALISQGRIQHEVGRSKTKPTHLYRLLDARGVRPLLPRAHALLQARRES